MIHLFLVFNKKWCKGIGFSDNHRTKGRFLCNVPFSNTSAIQYVPLWQDKCTDIEILKN